jgi:hypothetical protein
VWAGGGTPPDDGFFDPTATFVGAFGFTDWTAGWSSLELQPPVIDATEYTENFDAPVNLAVWTPNSSTHGDGKAVFGVSQQGNALRVEMDQLNFFDGQMYRFGRLFDLTSNPRASIRVKIEPGAKCKNADVASVAFGVSPFSMGADGNPVRQHAPVTQSISDDGEWHTYVFDWSAPDADPDTPGDLSRILYVLVETVRWPDTYDAVFWMDDFRLGGSAETTGVGDWVAAERPAHLTLKSNYPNPFNPSTQISYGLAAGGRVRLSVLDVRGRVVATLVDGVQDAGWHRVHFDASALSSGVYVYRLETQNRTLTNKMLLMK